MKQKVGLIVDSLQVSKQFKDFIDMSLTLIIMKLQLLSLMMQRYCPRDQEKYQYIQGFQI